jgi:hypothetical protein
LDFALRKKYGVNDNMPNCAWHKAKCRHNVGAHEFLSQNTSVYPDWEIVMLFYCAVHAVDSFFDTSSIPNTFRHPKKHKIRNKLVAKHLSQIAGDYGLLYQLGRTARYDATPPITRKDANDSSNAFGKISSFLHVP